MTAREPTFNESSHEDPASDESDQPVPNIKPWSLKDDWIVNGQFEIVKNEKNNKVIKVEDWIELEMIETLGKGTFCTVKKADGFYPEEDPENQHVPYAIKIFKKGPLKS